MELTPDNVLNWWDVFDRIGIGGVLLIIIGLIIRLAWVNVPRFLTWLESQTKAMISIHNELKEIRHELNSKKDT